MTRKYPLGLKGERIRMIKIEVKDKVYNTEINGTFAEVMTELTLAVACLLRSIAKEEKMPEVLVLRSFVAALKLMESFKEDVND